MLERGCCPSMCECDRRLPGASFSVFPGSGRLGITYSAFVGKKPEVLREKLTALGQGVLIWKRENLLISELSVVFYPDSFARNANAFSFAKLLAWLCPSGKCAQTRFRIPKTLPCSCICCNSEVTGQPLSHALTNRPPLWVETDWLR